MLGEEGEAIALRRLLTTKKFQKTESRCQLSPNVLVHALRELSVCAYTCMCITVRYLNIQTTPFPESRLGTYNEKYKYISCIKK